jgi:hypothetical protein
MGNLFMKIQGLVREQLASTDQKYLDLLASDADWIIRNTEDLSSLRTAGVEPFSKLSNAAFQQFVDSIKFSQGGLGHADYSSLMKELAITEIFEAFAYFGLGAVQLLDHADKECESVGTCSPALSKVCTSSC